MDPFHDVADTLQALHDWFVWVAIALIWLVTVTSITSGFVIWGVLRIARLLEAPRQAPPAPPGSYSNVPYGHIDYGPRRG